MKHIKICGIPFKIKEVDIIDEGYTDGVVLGKIIHSNGKILIKRDIPKELKKSVIFHEVLHGILVQLEYDEFSSDETFVQSLSNAMYNMFEFKEEITDGE